MLENVEPEKIFLMPQAAKQDEYIKKIQMAADLCERSGFRLSSRLQILLWNNQKGR
jgi:organic radical activating enzyme